MLDHPLEHGPLILQLVRCAAQQQQLRALLAGSLLHAADDPRPVEVERRHEHADGLLRAVRRLACLQRGGPVGREDRAAVHAYEQPLGFKLLQVAAERHRRDVELLGQLGDSHRAGREQSLENEVPPLGGKP